MKTKVCNKCKQEKPINEFCKTKSNKSGYTAYCKNCHSKTMSDWRKQNPNHVKGCRKNYDKNYHPVKMNRRRERRSWALTELGGCCIDCGLKYNGGNSGSFDIHHLDPSKRKFKISGCKLDLAIESIKKELDKCVLLCKPCHNKRHSDYKKGLRETL